MRADVFSRASGLGPHLRECRGQLAGASCSINLLSRRRNVDWGRRSNGTSRLARSTVRFSEEDLVTIREVSETIDVSVKTIEKNIRDLTATIRVRAPPESVWDALTSYDALQEFVPGLTENTCLERLEGGAVLKQVGETATGFGITFKAKVILRIREYPHGSTGFCEGLIPDATGPGVMDISFEQVEGTGRDFKDYRGLWRMMRSEEGHETELLYALRVRPKPWLPIYLVTGQVRKEIKKNLACVRFHVEGNKEITEAISRTQM